MAHIREARIQDVPVLLSLMTELAQFEGYAEDFAVTESWLTQKIKQGNSDNFGVFLLESDQSVCGYASLYQIDFTYTLKPTLVLKELYLQPEARHSGGGKLLFDRLVQYGSEIGARKLTWQVLPDNDRAKSFYRKNKGQPDTNWEIWDRSL